MFNAHPVVGVYSCVRNTWIQKKTNLIDHSLARAPTTKSNFPDKITFESYS